MSANPETSVDGSATGLAAWIPQLARGIIALALGITVTLTLDHSAGFGLVSFGIFAALTGAVLLVGSVRGAYATGARPAFIAQSVVALLCGIACLTVPSAGIRYLALVVVAFALLAGALELISGILARRRNRAARDWLLVGALTIVLGVVVLVVPPDLVQPFAGEKGAAGTLTGPVILVGVLGAWAVVTGVLQTISAVSLRTPPPVTS